MSRKTLALVGLAAAGLWMSAARAQDIVLPGVLELSGAGAVSGVVSVDSVRLRPAGAQGRRAGNRDERKYACPNDVDLHRPAPRDHLAFSFGPRTCAGQGEGGSSGASPSPSHGKCSKNRAVSTSGESSRWPGS